MADISHSYGGDLAFGSNGDLQPVTGLTFSQQRILRRLLTNPGAYIWDPGYGAGLPQKIGEPYTLQEIDALIRGQMYLERSCARIPEPDITVTELAGGIAVQIIYTEADSSESLVLSFQITP